MRRASTWLSATAAEGACQRPKWRQIAPKCSCELPTKYLPGSVAHDGWHIERAREESLRVADDKADGQRDGWNLSTPCCGQRDGPTVDTGTETGGIGVHAHLGLQDSGINP